MTFSMVFSVAYVVGRAFMPSFGPTLRIPLADKAGAGAALLDDLTAQLNSITDPAALIEMTGAIEGHFVLDHADVPFEFETLGSEGPDYGPNMPVDVDARYTGGGATLNLVANQVEAGLPRTEAITILISVDGRSFNARPGDCTLELASAGYVPEEGGSGFMLYWPAFVGHVVCTDVAELRGEETISFTAVFDHGAPH